MNPDGPVNTKLVLAWRKSLEELPIEEQWAWQSISNWLALTIQENEMCPGYEAMNVADEVIATLWLKGYLP